MAFLRRVLVLSVVLALLIPLGGCWVYSMYPLAGPDDELVFDRFLAGHWWNPQNRCSVTFTRLPGERAYRVVYITAKDGGDNCWLGKDQSASFQGIVVELGGARFLDVVPADMPLQNHMALTHSFYRLKVDQNSLSLTPLTHETMKSLVAEDKLRGIQRSDEMVVLTSSTKELRDFFRLNATNDDVWNSSGRLEFQRRADGQ
jgi:hypothetical protein